jgi:hypothetical protein
MEEFVRVARRRSTATRGEGRPEESSSGTGYSWNKKITALIGQQGKTRSVLYSPWRSNIPNLYAWRASFADSQIVLRHLCFPVTSPDRSLRCLPLHGHHKAMRRLSSGH